MRPWFDAHLTPSSVRSSNVTKANLMRSEQLSEGFYRVNSMPRRLNFHPNKKDERANAGNLPTDWPPPPKKSVTLSRPLISSPVWYWHEGSNRNRETNVFGLVVAVMLFKCDVPRVVTRSCSSSSSCTVAVIGYRNSGVRTFRTYGMKTCLTTPIQSFAGQARWIGRLVTRTCIADISGDGSDVNWLTN